MGNEDIFRELRWLPNPIITSLAHQSGLSVCGTDALEVLWVYCFDFLMRLWKLRASHHPLSNSLPVWSGRTLSVALPSHLIRCTLPLALHYRQQLADPHPWTKRISISFSHDIFLLREVNQCSLISASIIFILLTHNNWQLHGCEWRCRQRCDHARNRDLLYNNWLRSVITWLQSAGYKLRATFSEICL